jgi:tetratricopeptide (TPR) repeat protein
MNNLRPLISMPLCLALLASLFTHPLPVDAKWGLPQTTKALHATPQKTPVKATPLLSPKEEAVVLYNEGVRLFQASQDNTTQSIGDAYRLRQDAKKAFNNALKLNPELVEAHSNLGYIELAESHAKKAVSYFEKAVALNAKHEASVAGLAIALNESGNPTRAIELLSSLTKWYPESERHWFNLGTIFQQEARNEEAIDAYKNALLVNPKHPPTFFNLATLYHESKQAQSAWTYYERCIQMDPGSALALQSQNRILQLEKSFPDVINSKPPIENR